MTCRLFYDEQKIGLMTYVIFCCAMFCVLFEIKKQNVRKLYKREKMEEFLGTFFLHSFEIVKY